MSLAITRAALVGVVALSSGLACTEAGRSIVLVDVTAPGVMNLSKARVIVTDTTDKELAHANSDWSGSPSPLKLGVYLPKSVSGSVGVVACGFDMGGNVIGSGRASGQITVTPGATSAQVSVVLDPTKSSPLCAGGGTGGTGGSTGGSAGGTSGTGGGGSSGSAGTGGSAGGTSGTGGGGIAGTGGGAGTGGSAGTGGRGGTSGTGGGAGTGGVAGTGGRGGAGGTGGSVGGTGGTAGRWQGATLMPTPVAGQQQRNPTVAVDAAGNAVVIYDQGGQIWANRYDRITGWGMPGAVDSRAMLQGTPQIAVDRDGHYLAVWGLQTGSSVQGIWYSTSDDGIAWLPMPRSITTTVSVFPVLAMNPDGAALVAWSEQTSGGGQYQAVGAARPAPGTPWELKVLQTAEYGDRNPAVAMTGGGYGFVGWVQTDGLANGWNSVWMAQYTVGTGWSQTPGLLEEFIGHNAYNVSIAANSTEAIATYIQITTANPPKVQLWSRRFSPSTSWATALPIFEANSIDTTLPASVTLDDTANANATVAFAVETTAGTYQVQTSRTAKAATAWPAPTSLDTDDIAKADDPNSNIADATLPIVRSDPAGNVTLVWRKRTTASGLRFDLVSKRYTAGAWTPLITDPAVSLEANTTNSVFWPTMAVGAGGTAVTTWYFGNTLDVWANVWR